MRLGHTIAMGRPQCGPVCTESLPYPYPASTLVQVAQLIDPEWLIEIKAVAVIPFVVIS